MVAVQVWEERDGKVGGSPPPRSQSALNANMLWQTEEEKQRQGNQAAVTWGQRKDAD